MKNDIDDNLYWNYLRNNFNNYKENWKMSYVNLNTKKIVGCKPGTKEWFHEEGHIIYNDSEKGIRNSYRMSFWFYIAVTFAIFSLPFSVFSLSALIFILLFWFYFVYEEFWCWDYALRKLKGGEKNGLEKIKRKKREGRKARKRRWRI